MNFSAGSGAISASKRKRLLGGGGAALASRESIRPCTSRPTWYALGDVVGGLDHRPVDRGEVRVDPLVVSAELVGVLVSGEADRLEAAGHQHVGLARANALRGHRNRLQTGRAEAVDGRARSVTGKPARTAIWRAMFAAGGALG